ncbi:sugar phosphate isomerase/epimerase family protein [Edaphobacter flagellatus]|uniref:sugar phosphate isomerase/epimerase family protein n=1 Tax=Edaphobacter flagellatus TaxID=1933044 RepID=UPI0021B4C870|nr:sugar phosphate isomerase/epimerase [Edaphobacter flagellatus]
MVSRRRFLGGAAAVAASFSTRFSFGSPLGLPIGIQLYSVRAQMAEDFEGALAAVREAGYVEVEAAALPKKSAAEIRAALDKAGLRCVSAHHSFADVTTRYDQTVEFNKTLGVSYIICPGPGRRNPPAAGTKPGPITLDDWHYNAEQFNIVGAKMKSAGLTFGYHNHTLEFAPVEGKVPYDELMRLCEPDKVSFELDCGWAKVAGQDPVAIFKKYPHRISMVHVKDFKLAANPSHENREESKVTELGRGSIDYRPIFAAAPKTQQIKHAFVEQEAFDIPWKDSLKVDADYLKSL